MTMHSTDTIDRTNTTNTSSTAAPTRTVAKAPNRSPLVGDRKPWTPWQDWVNVAIGAYLVLAPLWTATAPTGWFVTMGILAMAAGLWAAGTGSASAAEWTQIIIGVILFLAPFFGGFAGLTAGALTAWIAGAALAVLAAVAMSQNKQVPVRPNAHA